MDSPVKRLTKGGERLGCSWSVSKGVIKQKANPSKFLSSVEHKKHQYNFCASDLVGPKMVNFALNQNARHTTGIPFPTLLSFFTPALRVCTDDHSGIC